MTTAGAPTTTLLEGILRVTTVTTEFTPMITSSPMFTLLSNVTLFPTHTFLSIFISPFEFGCRQAGGCQPPPMIPPWKLSPV